MKNLIRIFMLLCSAAALAQTPKDVLARQVDEYVATVNRAAERFLNKRLAPAERIEAIEPHAVLYDEKQVEQFKAVVLDEREPPEVRAAALARIHDRVPADERLSRLTVEWLGNPESPKPLRRAALDLTASLSFSAGTEGLKDVFQRMLDDPDPAFRQFAFTQLVVHGDVRAQQRLIQGLEDPASAPLPAPTAISILSMALKKEYYPALYKLMLETDDEATRLEAVRALGFYPEAREKLIAISRDPKEKEPFREAALAALYAGDRDNIVQYAMPIVADRSAPPRLQGIAIQMTIDVRQLMAYRVRAKRADEYDRLIKGVADDPERHPEVRGIAAKYVQSVRPRY